MVTRGYSCSSRDREKEQNQAKEGPFYKKITGFV
jgi:hypothetical protein